MLGYYVPLQNNLFVGIIVTFEQTIYLNTSPKFRSEVEKDFSIIPNITFTTTIPENIQALADKIYLITQGIDQDTSQVQLDYSDYTEKQVIVIKTAMNIPVNEIWPYSKVAEGAGLPKAQRFVGTTMRILRQPYIVPVHRVKSISYIRKKKSKSKRRFDKMPI